MSDLLPKPEGYPMSQGVNIARHLRIFGRVQGVWYRESMRRQAESVGVVGWVRNMSDGSVEAWLEGDGSSIDSIIVWARRGPPYAQVSRVEIETVRTEGHHQFSVLSKD
jgi:acylphosphatase